MNGGVLQTYNGIKVLIQNAPPGRTFADIMFSLVFRSDHPSLLVLIAH